MRYSVYKVSFLKIQDPDETMKIVNDFFSNTSQKIYTIYNISDSLDTEKQGTNTFFSVKLTHMNNSQAGSDNRFKT